MIDANYFDAALGRALAEDGIASSFENADEQNKLVAHETIEQCAHEFRYFNSEHVWAKLRYRTDHTIDPKQGSFLGQLLRNAARDGLIELAHGYTQPSARPANHSRIMRVWKSLAYQGSAPDHCPLCGSLDGGGATA